MLLCSKLPPSSSLIFSRAPPNHKIWYFTALGSENECLFQIKISTREMISPKLPPPKGQTSQENLLKTNPPANSTTSTNSTPKTYPMPNPNSPEGNFPKYCQMFTRLPTVSRRSAKTGIDHDEIHCFACENDGKVSEFIDGNNSRGIENNQKWTVEITWNLEGW